MNKITRFLASLTITAFTLNMMAASAASLITLSAPTDLKVNMLTDAYGISTDSPTFSWVMNDSGTDKTQSAYEIIVSSSLSSINSGNADIYDTGKVSSAESSYVKISNLSLSENSIYYWKVRIWDNDGLMSGYSEPSAITTEVGSKWASNDTFWGGTSDYYSDWTDYTIELDMNITSKASGICFRKTGGSGYYMWQFNADDNTLVPHVCTNGQYKQLASVGLGEKGVEISSNSDFHVKIVLESDSITTYVNDVLVDQRTLKSYSCGTMGFRNGLNESASYKNVRLYKTDSDGNVGSYLYCDQFAYGGNQFSGGSLSDGALALGKNQSAFLSAVTAYSKWSNFTLSLDMNITSNAAGIDFRVTDGGSSYYLWQFDAESNSLNEYVCESGELTRLSCISLSSSGICLLTDKFFNVKISAQDDKITTFVDNVQVDSSSQSYLATGTIGFSSGSSDYSSFKNVSVTALDDDEKAENFADSFSSGSNDFSGGTVSDSELSVEGLATICLKPDGQNGDFMFLRDEFAIADTSKIEKAVISVTATSTDGTKQYTYGLYLNGKYVGSGPEAPLNGETRYNTYDVTSMLINGSNAIGSLNYALSGKQFLLQMTVYYNDGTSKILLNSGRDYNSWRALDGTSVFGESNSVGTTYYTQAAENIDANLYPFDWSKAGFDDSAWQPVKSSGSISSDSLEPSEISNIQMYTSNAKSVEDNGDGNYFIDLGKEVIGGIKLTVTSPSACTVTLRYGEEKNSNSSVIYSLRTSNCYEEKWTLKAGTQTISNFGLKSFRYIEILNCPVKITTDNINSISMRQDFNDSASDFTSSSTELNKIYNVSKYTVKETNQNLGVDSQVRERGVYQGDELITMLSNFAVNPDSTLSRYTTEYLNYNSSWPAEYKLMSVILTWNYYIYTGDLDIVSEYYDKLKAGRLYDSCFDSTYNLIKSPGNDTVLVDWPDDEQDDYNISGATYNTVLNSVAYKAYQDMALMAKQLNKTADYNNYSDKAEKIQNAMITYLYNSDIGAFSDGLTSDGNRIEHYAQHASAFALACGVINNKTIEQSAANYIAGDNCFKTSVYGAFFVLSGLYGADAGSTAMKLLTGTGIRSWNHMIDDLGATITAEDWDTSLKSNMTFSHSWGSSPANQIVTGLFGIQPLTAGFSTFQIKFQTGGLESASIKVPTVKGAITAEFDTTSDFSATVGIPCNTEATVYIPASGNASLSVLVDGKNKTAEKSGNYLVVQLGSGNHTISVN